MTRGMKRTLTSLIASLGLVACTSSSSETKKESPSTPASAPAEEKPAAEAAPAEAAPAEEASLTPPPRKSDADRKSKNGRLEAEIGGANLIVQYGRPTVRGRTIFGDLIAYGKLWRTGADEATTFTVDQPVMVEGKPLDAGTYALFTVPGEKAWTVVFNSVAAQWGAYGYDESKDVLRVEVTPKKGEATEELTFAVDGEDLVLRWADVVVPIRITTKG